MKVLLFTHDLNIIGGIETSFYNLARYLSSSYEVGVRYNTAHPAQVERFHEAGIDIQPQKEEPCDILLVGSIAKLPYRIRAKVIVQQAHADWSDSFWGDTGVPSTIARLNYNVDIFAPVSESSATFVRKYAKKPVVVMNNIAPEPKNISRKSHSKLVLAAFTRMTHEKGLKNYEALQKHLKQLCIDHELRVYTNGDAPKGWKKHEPVRDITTVLPEVDYVCSLADTESFGYTIAEANACGVPCIIKKANSTLEFFDPKENIILERIEDLKDLNTKPIKYTLDKETRQSVDKAMEVFKDLASQKSIIRVMKPFFDVQAQQHRRVGDIVSLESDRASELISNSFRIAEAYNGL